MHDSQSEGQDLLKPLSKTQKNLAYQEKCSSTWLQFFKYNNLALMKHCCIKTVLLLGVLARAYDFSTWDLETRGLDLVTLLHLCVFLKNKFLEHFLDQSIH